MPDVATISAALTSLKTATDIVRALRDIDISLEKAETKLKIVDLADALVEARMKVVEVQELLQEKDKIIAQLEDAFNLKSKLVRRNDVYFEVDEKGNIIDDPYCSHCWEISHKGIHLTYSSFMTERVCPACKTEYSPQCTSAS